MRKIGLYILAIVALSSCTEKIDFDLNEGDNQRLVVDGILTTEAKKQRIILSRTTSYYHNETAPGESNAVVTVTDGSRTLTFLEVSNGVYETATIDSVEVGKTYTLNITTSDNEVYTAETYVHRKADVDSISYKWSNLWDEYALYFYGNEPAGPGDYYMWQVEIDGQLDNDTLSEIVFGDDQFVDGSYIPGVEFYYISPDKLSGDTTDVTVRWVSINKEYYEWAIAALLETEWRGSPFDGPPANIPTNISNGGLGFFMGTSSSGYSFKLVK